MSSVYKLKTEYGKITINADTVNNIVFRQLVDIEKIYILNSNKKNVSSFPKKGKINTDGIIQTIKEDEGFIVDIKVAFKFGISINEKANEILDKVSVALEKSLGVKANKIIVNVVAVVAKKIAQRNIVIQKRYDA